MDDWQFRQLLEFFELSWQGYRKVRKGVKKRVSRHMQASGCRSMPAYLERLERSAELRGQCERLMSVSISRFFRDRRLWEALRDRVLPDLIQTRRDRLRVWSAGCACGEEVYSLKILWEHLRRPLAGLPALQITATDLNPVHLEKAQAALYSLSSLKEVPENLKTSCFQAQPGANRFKVKPALRSGITWLTHDFFSGCPGSGYQLIFVRNNLLTYYQNKRIGPVLDEMINSLCMGGYMVIGSNEKLPFRTSALQPCASLPYAFKKRELLAEKLLTVLSEG